MKTSPRFRSIARSVVLAAIPLAFAACGSSSNITGPGPGPTNANVTISIVGMNGNQSFAPNPAAVPQGQTVAFRNNDSTTHAIVADNGAFDAGTLAPGATSAPIAIRTTSAIPYHCTIHPTMVGVINGATSGSPGGPGY